jgi:hypothetical protein
VSDQKGIDRLWEGVWPRNRPTALIGVATGVISGIAVIDIDPRRGGDRWFFENRDRLPKTRTHETQSFGQHLIYRHLPGLQCSKDEIAPGVEIKADGGYIIWWPAHGGRVLCEGPVAEFPIGGLGSTLKPDRSTVDPSPPFVGPPTAHEINYAKKALGNACYELRHCSEKRNTKLNVLAFNMGRLIARGWIGLDRVEDYLLKACEANGLLEDDGIGQCKATLASGISAGMKRPYRNIEDAA